MIATIINTNVNKLSYVTYISTTPSARLRNEWKAVPPSCLGKYIILLWSPGSSGECREDFYLLLTNWYSCIDILAMQFQEDRSIL